MTHIDKKQGKWYVNKKCNHAKNEVDYSKKNYLTFVEQIQRGVKGEQGKKWQQFATILHLLQQGQPILEFEALKSLFSFLNVPLLPKHNWSDSMGWVMAKCMHKQIINRVKEVIASSKYLALSFNEVTTIDNQSWISIHSYVVQDWCHIHVLISLEQVIERGGANNLIKVIMGALKKHCGI